MPLTRQCPSCSEPLTVPDASLGTRWQCRKCGQTFVIQPAEAPAAQTSPVIAPAPGSVGRPPPLPAAVPPPVPAPPAAPMVSGVIVWTGMWFMMDTQTEVCLDGYLLGRGSVIKGFQIPFAATLGPHTLSLSTPLRGVTAYQLYFTEPGTYAVTAQYSRITGNWSGQCAVQRTA